MKTRVYLVDSHHLIRHGLAALIDGQADMEICGEAENARAALAAIVKLNPDVVTIEIWLNGNSGLELIKSIKAFNPEIGILVLSMCDETVYACRVIKAGARGFVSKQDKIDNVLDAIRRVRNRCLYLSDDMESKILTRIAGVETAGDSPVSNLSDRELEIGHLIGSGLVTNEIAERLYVSVKTVETHRSHLKKKLGLQNGTRLLQFWIRWVERLHMGPESDFVSTRSTSRT